jgi:misacylated tRNA(Ala) deacylase
MPVSAELLFRSDAYAQSATAHVVAADAQGVRFDRTIFYPLGGGQPGDIGFLRWSGGETPIRDTRKWKFSEMPEDVAHVVSVDAILPPIGTEIEIILDWPRRYAHMRMHTCMHLLCAVLPGIAVTGGQVGDAKSRLDFDMPTGQLDKDALTAALNALIVADHPVTERWITDAEMAERPDLVRTMSVKPPTGLGRVRLLAVGDNVDLQPCGGTHVRRTGEIGAVEIVKIENKGKQNRRVVLAFKGSRVAAAA